MWVCFFPPCTDFSIVHQYIQHFNEVSGNKTGKIRHVAFYLLCDFFMHYCTMLLHIYYHEKFNAYWINHYTLLNTMSACDMTCLPTDNLKYVFTHVSNQSFPWCLYSSCGHSLIFTLIIIIINPWINVVSYQPPSVTPHVGWSKASWENTLQWSKPIEQL